MRRECQLKENPERTNDSFFYFFNLPDYFTNKNNYVSDHLKNFKLTFSKLVLVRLYILPFLFQTKIKCYVKINWPHFSSPQLFHLNIYVIAIAQIYNQNLFKYLPIEVLWTTVKWK